MPVSSARQVKDTAAAASAAPCNLAQHECEAAGVWLHGEAVAAGTVMAADMSYRLGWIEKDILDRTVRLLERAKLPIAAPAVSPQSFWPKQYPSTRYMS